MEITILYLISRVNYLKNHKIQMFWSNSPKCPKDNDVPEIISDEIKTSEELHTELPAIFPSNLWWHLWLLVIYTCVFLLIYMILDLIFCLVHELIVIKPRTTRRRLSVRSLLENPDEISVTSD